MKISNATCDTSIMSCPEPFASEAPPAAPPPAISGADEPVERARTSVGSAYATRNAAGAGGAPPTTQPSKWTTDDAADCRTTVGGVVAGAQAAATTAFVIAKNVPGAFAAAFVGHVLKDRVPQLVCPPGETP